MAHVYIEKIDEAEYVGVEKISNKKESRTFTFKKEEFDFICEMLKKAGHNYSYIETDESGVRKFVRETESFSKRVLIFSLLTAIVTTVLMLFIEFNTNFDEMYYYERSGFIMLRILIISIVGAGLMLYSDTKKIESSLNWKDVKVHEHYIKGNWGVYSRNLIFGELTPSTYNHRDKVRIRFVPKLCLHSKIAWIALGVSVLLLTPMYSLAIRSLAIDYSADNQYWFSVTSILLTTALSFSCTHKIGIVFANLVNKYENTPKLKFYIRNMNR